MSTQARSLLSQLTCQVKQILSTTAILAVLGIATPLSAQQTGWIQIAANQSGEMRVSVNPARITQTTQGHIRTWTRWDYSHPQTTRNGARYTRIMRHEEINCANQQTRLLSGTVYNETGEVVEQESSSSWESMVPESVGEQIVNEICDYAARVQTPLTAAPVAPTTRAAPARVTEPQERSRTSLCEALNGASLIADDGTFLGTIESQYASRSILNEYGTYGSRFNTNSIWNEFGQYGSQFSTKSAFNRYTTSPPRIVYDGEVLGYLTVNNLMQNAVDPALLRTCRF